MKSKTRNGGLVEIFFLRIIADGRTVEGTVTGSEFDITVSIISPYRNLSKGLHIPYFARRQRSLNGLYGHVRALELLSDLYNAGTHLRMNFAALAADWERTQLEIADLPTGDTKNINLRAMELEDRYFEKQFGEIISVSLRRSLIPLLEGRIRFE